MQSLAIARADSTFTLLKRAAFLYFRHPRLALVAGLSLPVVVLDVMSRGDLTLSLFSALLSFATFFVVIAALAYSSGELLAGREPGVLEAYHRVARRHRTFLGVMLAYFLGIVLPLGTLIGIPVGLYLTVRWWFAPHAAALRDVSAGEALRMSSAIVKGAWWQMFGRTVALVILAGLPVATAGILLGFIEPYLAVIAYIVATLLLPIPTTFHTILFVNAVDTSLTNAAARLEVRPSP